MARNAIDFYRLDPSGNGDNAVGLANMAADLRVTANAKKPLPRIVFPEGIYKFSQWPNFAIHNLEMVSEGQTILRYTGTDDAMTFMGEETGQLPGIGKRNILFDGFEIDPGLGAQNSLVIASCHASNFNVKVHGAGTPRGAGTLFSAVCLRYCVGTELRPTISPQLDNLIDGFGGSPDCNGVMLDILNGNTDWPASACRINRPIIEGVINGIYSASSFYCEVLGGTIEQCQNGYFMLRGAYNYSSHVEMEGNKNLDVYCTKDAHDNVWALCGDGKRSHFKSKFEGYGTNNQVTYMGPLWS